MDPLTRQLADVQKRYPNARFATSPDGQRLLVVPGVSLGPGWSCREATVSVVVPAGYPHVNPDCFYTDAGLRLASGADPGSSYLQAVLGAITGGSPGTCPAGIRPPERWTATSASVRPG
jgi:hypothetical protein